MSVLLGAALPQFILTRDPACVCDLWFQGVEYRAESLPDDYRTPWWPARSIDLDAFLDLNSSDFWQWLDSGSNGRLGFVGVTRDATGAPLGGCTVRAFVTATNELVSQVTSDANGNYVATSPYLENHYLVVHKSAAVPPVAGASIDTVQPA